MNLQELLNICPQPAPGAMCRKEEFGAMLVAGNLPILNLNIDAYKIWQLCDGTRTIAEIEATLQQEYEIEGLHDRMLDFFMYCLDNNLLISKAQAV